MAKPANLLLATLRAKLAAERNPLEQQALRRRIREVSAQLARAEFEDKAGPLRREMHGAY